MEFDTKYFDVVNINNVRYTNLVSIRLLNIVVTITSHGPTLSNNHCRKHATLLGITHFNNNNHWATLICGIYVSIVWVTQELEPKGYYFTGFPTLHLLHSKDYFLCHFQYMCCGIHPLHHRAYIFLQPTCRFLFVSGVNIWCPRVVYAYLCLCLCVL